MYLFFASIKVKLIPTGDKLVVQLHLLYFWQNSFTMEWVTYLLLIIPLAIAPGIAIALFIYFRDKYEKEPFRLLRGCFLFGMLSVVPAALIELLEGVCGFDEKGNILMLLAYAFIGVGMVEELCKFFFVRVYAYSKPAFNEPFDGIVYAVMVAMGFATAENVLYACMHGLSVTLLRLFTAVPLHATCGIIMGFYIGLAKFRPGPLKYILLGLLIPIVIHGAYDFFLFQQDYPALMVLAFVCLAAAVAISFIAIRSHQKRSPFKNGIPPQTTIPPDQNNPPQAS
jgi:RsiW-degrading membrane proteinase PrsW (M82 family)